MSRALSEALAAATSALQASSFDPSGDTEGRAIRAAETLAHALSAEPGVRSIARPTSGDVWLEPWAAALPLRVRADAVRLVRRTTVVETEHHVTVIDPVLPSAFASTPLAERIRSLLGLGGAPAEGDARTFVRDRVGPLERVTEVVLTSVRFHALAALVGTRRGDGLADALAPLFPNARIYVGQDDWSRLTSPIDAALPAEERASHAREDAPRLDDRALEPVADALRLPSGLVVLPTAGHTPGALSVAIPLRTTAGGRSRIRVVSSQATTRDAYGPYESELPGFRTHARLRDTDVVPRGDALDLAAHLRALRFERALADRDLADPRFADITPSLELTLTAS